MKYNYPIDSLKIFQQPISVFPENHTMGNSLYKYLKMKISNNITTNIKHVVIRPLFDRTCGISANEKSDKMFNYMRPTTSIKKDVAYINCFPGIDYVFHYGNIYKTYYTINNVDLNVNIELPSEKMCFDALLLSGLNKIPKSKIVVMGNVQQIDKSFSNKYNQNSNWIGNSNFLWKWIVKDEILLLGCKHTYWGEISARIVLLLAEIGVETIIYSGKLGGLKCEYHPNISLATGNKSILPNGNVVEWNNIFQEDMTNIFQGTHITVPSVIQESKNWLNTIKNDVCFVAPEIGHMAYAASISGVNYSYLHIISDNLLKKYLHDLSNERNKEVISNRKTLYGIISDKILNLL